MDPDDPSSPISPDFDLKLPEDHPSTRVKNLLRQRSITDYVHGCDPETHLLDQENFSFKRWCGDLRCTYFVGLGNPREISLVSTPGFRTTPTYYTLIEEVLELSRKGLPWLEEIMLLPESSSKWYAVSVSVIHPYGPDGFCAETAGHVLDTTFKLMETFVPSCLMVIHGGLTPSDAVELNRIQQGFSDRR